MEIKRKTTISAIVLGPDDLFLKYNKINTDTKTNTSTIEDLTKQNQLLKEENEYLKGKLEFYKRLANNMEDKYQKCINNKNKTKKKY